LMWARPMPCSSVPTRKWARRPAPTRTLIPLCSSWERPSVGPPLITNFGRSPGPPPVTWFFALFPELLPPRYTLARIIFQAAGAPLRAGSLEHGREEHGQPQRRQQDTPPRRGQRGRRHRGETDEAGRDRDGSPGAEVRALGPPALPSR